MRDESTAQKDSDWEKETKSKIKKLFHSGCGSFSRGYSDNETFFKRIVDVYFSKWGPGRNDEARDQELIGIVENLKDAHEKFVQWYAKYYGRMPGIEAIRPDCSRLDKELKEE